MLSFLRNLKLKKLILFGFFLAVLGLASLTPTHAAINKQVNFQGRLTDSSGNVVADGTYNMEFKLYSVSSAGTALWTETRTTTNRVTVSKGLFSIQLGEVATLSSFNFNQDPLYLGVTVGGTATSPTWDPEMTPRYRLGAAPQAITSNDVQGYTPGNSSGNIPISNGTVNTNLNADLLDGQHGSYYQNGSNINAGTVGSSFLPSTVAYTNAANAFSAAQTFNNTVGINNTLTVTASNGIPAYFLTGSNTQPSAIYFGRAASESQFGVAAGAGHFVTDAQAGDFVIRNDSLSKAILISAGADTTSEIRIENNKLGFFGSTPVAQASTTADIKDALTAYGLLQGTSATALNLDGGTLTAGAINGTSGTITGTGGSTFQVKNGSDIGVLTVDTETTTDAQKVQIGDTGSTNAPVLLTLDSNSSDPSGAVNGSMYYNTTDSVFRCYTGGAWANCSGAGAASGASYARIFLNSAQNLTYNAYTTVSFDGEDADTDNYHSNVTNPSRVTAPTAGFYQLSASAAMTVNTTGGRVVAFVKNGTTTYFGTSQDATSGCGCTTNVTSTLGIYLNAGDYIEAQVYLNITGGGTLALSTGTGNTWLSIFKTQGGVSDTLQQTYDASTSPATITTSNAKDINFTLADTATDSNLVINTANNSTSKFSTQYNGTDTFSISNAAGAQGAALFKNATNSTNAFQIQNSSGFMILGVDTSTTSNLLSANPGFEVNTTNWSGTNGTLTRDTSQTYAGVAAGKMVESAANSVVRYSIGSTLASAQRTFSIFVRTTGSNFSTLNLGYNNGTTDTDVVTAKTVYAGGWVRYNFTVTAAVASVYVKDTGSAHTFWVDAAQLETGANASAYNPGGTLQLRGVINNPTVFQNKEDSANALAVNTAAGLSVFNVDTLSGVDPVGVEIGSPATDSNATLLTVDSYNQTADPTGQNGAMYYNSNTASFRCYVNGAWQSCGPQTKKVTSDVTNSTTTIADVTGLTFPTQVNTEYTLTCTVYYTTAATTTGIRFGVNAPGTSPVVAGKFDSYVGAAGSGLAANGGFFNANNTAAGTSAVGTASALTPGTLTAYIKTGTTTAGNVVVRFNSSAASAAVVKAGSSCSLTQL
jgi:hypothetical protein